jgi:hypothetical protein
MRIDPAKAGSVRATLMSGGGHRWGRSSVGRNSERMLVRQWSERDAGEGEESATAEVD